MISFNALFWMFVILFAIIGGMRGWAKELLVVFSVILTMFILTVTERFVPFIRENLAINNPDIMFWVRSALLLTLAFFGYQTPTISKLAGNNRFAREKLQDMLLGAVLGAFNGYLIFGSIWYYLDLASYIPFANFATAPQPGTPAGEAALAMIKFLPPSFFGSPTIYFITAVCFVFVLVVFL